MNNYYVMRMLLRTAILVAWSHAFVSVVTANQISFNSTTTNSSNSSNTTTSSSSSKMGFEKVLQKLGGSPQPVPAAPATTMNQPPNKRQIMQNRYNHGPNFGGMFVQEKWISDEVFGEKANGTSEYDAVKSSVKQYGMNETRQRFENHWNNWIKDDDWLWLRDHGVTAVRLPIGYWHVNNGQFCKGTDFSKYSDVYQSAWDNIKSIITKADSYGIGVLVDLHGLPGGANGQDHSGTCSGKAELWKSGKNQTLSTDVLEFMARDLRPYDNVCAIQILNEAPFENNTKPQEEFYLKAIERIRTVNDDIPLAISDGWNLTRWVDWVKHKEGKLNGRFMGVVIDTHVYKCFGDDDKQKPPGQLLNEVDNSVVDTDEVDIIVGEYSCVLDGQSWDKHDNSISREDLVRQYGQKENWAFYHRARAGSYFWTYKFEHGRGGEWDFREMSDKGAIPNLKVVRPKDDAFYEQQLTERLQGSLQQHEGYWRGVDGGKDWEFWRYGDGFTVGFNDARAFDKFDNSEIGRLVAWRKSRLAEHIQMRGNSEVVWGFEHGFKQGVQSFLEARNM